MHGWCVDSFNTKKPPRNILKNVVLKSKSRNIKLPILDFGVIIWTQTYSSPSGRKRETELWQQLLSLLFLRGGNVDLSRCGSCCAAPFPVEVNTTICRHGLGHSLLTINHCLC